MNGRDRPEASGSPDKGAAESPSCHLIGGGIASLAAAVFLIRDARVPGNQITIYEQSPIFGGSLDGRRSSEGGYVIRGGRMFEENFVCTFDLLSSIEATDAPGKSIKDEIDAFNLEVVGSSCCRLVREGRKADMSAFELRARDLYQLVRLLMRSERSLADVRIEDCFSDTFFRTNFWLMWSTTFAFHSWHSATEFRRYLRRLIHLLPGLKKLEGVLRTRFNQYDSLIAPILDWLEGQGVHFLPGHQIVDLEIVRHDSVRQVAALQILRHHEYVTVPIAEGDRVFLTLGSMTECSSFGSTSAPPIQRLPNESGAWNLWHKLAERDPAFGNPMRFGGDLGKARWESFTVTLGQPDFFDFMRSFTGNTAGTGGLVTFTDSNWLLSIVLFHQPHFRDQSDDEYVFWGYGLFPDRQGNFVTKPMSECSGREILQELAGLLGLDDGGARLFGDAVSIPCMMPFITSQFMPRSPGDRPAVILEPGSNFAVMGQFCEVPDDVVFTVEFSVRSAMTAVYSLVNVEKEVPKVRRTFRSPSVLIRAMKAILRG